MRAYLPVLFLALGLALVPAWAATAAPPQPDGASEQLFFAGGGNC